MLQQTQVKTVVPYYHAFLSEFPDISVLSSTDLHVLLKTWEGLGYYARARNLHKAAKKVMTEYDGRIPDAYDAIITLPGVGGYVAAAVLSFAYGLPYAVVDGNVKRVISRVFAMDLPVNRPASHRIFQATADRLIDRQQPARFNQAIMELGALVCTPRNPQCKTCPLGEGCQAYLQGAAGRFPVRDRRKPVPVYEMAIGAICAKHRLLIVRRPVDGLLGGLWEFPGGTVNDGEPPDAACSRIILESTGLRLTGPSLLSHIRHAYSHFKVKAAVYTIEHGDGEIELSGPAEHAWVSADELQSYPLTGVARKILPLLPPLPEPGHGVKVYPVRSSN